MSFRNKNRSLVAVAATALVSMATGVAWAQGTSTSGAGSSASGDVCTSKQAAEVLVACPNTGPTQFNVTQRGKAPATNFRSAPPPQDLKRRDAQTQPGAPSETQSAAQRDERASRLQPKVRALLVTEIQGLERLFSSTSKRSPDRVQLARRLAENYVELESAAFRDKIEAEIKAGEAKQKKQAANVKKFQTDASTSNRVMLAARKKAIEYYTLIKTDYPNYAQLDEVLYYLAYEYEQAADYVNARKVYYELIENVPQSKYIPNAYLAFGELFFNEAQNDPSKWDLAAASYREVVKYPAPENKVFGYAHYKLAYVHWNKGEFARALDEFKKTIDYGTQFANLPNAAALATSARRDIIPVYALSGKPEAAFNFFRTLSGDGKGETAKTFKMMDDLGQNYLDTGHYREAIVLYQDLMKRDRGERLCKYQSNVTQATMAMKSSAKETIRAELDRQIEVYKDFQAGNYSAEAKLQCANASAELVTETAMAWHLEAVGSGGVRGTGDQKTMTLSSYLYKKVIDNFTSEQFAEFEFPRIVKEDWPTILRVKYAMADLLYFQQRWADCGPAFDAVVEEDPNGPDAAEAAYAAVLCYQNIYAQTHQGGSDRKGRGQLPGQEQAKKGAKADESAKYKAKDFTPQQEGMVNAFNRYICYIKPPEDDKDGQDQLVEVKYARARTFFEAQRWEEAALAFRDVAVNHSDRDVGIYAAQLYLESLNVLGTHSDPPRPSCFQSMADDVPLFLDLYCKGDKFAKNEEQCTILTKIQCDIERLKAEKTVELADKGGPNALRLYEEAGNDYINIWRKYGEEPLRNRMAPQCERLDEVVYNGARAFQAGRLIAKSIQARLILINPQNGLDKSPLAKKAIYEIGGNYQAIAVYDEAANWYERYARENPRGENADKALSDATLLRLGLGQEEEAIRNAELYNRQYGNRFPQQSAAIAFGVASHYVEKEDWDRARSRLQSSISLIERNATFDVVVQAHAMLGRVYTQLKNERSAKQAYAKVRSLWGDGKSAEQKIMGIAGEDDGQKLRRLARALTAVGEALFYFAEEKRAAAEAIAFPAYKGPGSRDAVLKHINGPVADWMKKKAPAIEAAEQEYLKIVELQPAPPPRWVIAAGSQVGTLWGNFVRDFRAAPIPAAWKNDVEMRNAYYGALDERSEPIKVRAKGAFETCLKYSVEYQYFDEYSRACEVWLSRTYRNEYHAVDEFRPAPGLKGSGLDDRPYAVQIGGDVYRVEPAVTQTSNESAAEAASGEQN